MFGQARQGAAAYARIGVDTGVLAANPHQLILLLFEGALLAMGTALSQMQSGDLAGKGKSISHAIAIVNDGLAANLDMGTGGEIAHNLDALYNYIGRLLLSANLHSDPLPVQEAQRLLLQLKESWVAIGRQPQTDRSATTTTGVTA